MVCQSNFRNMDEKTMHCARRVSTIMIVKTRKTPSLKLCIFLYDSKTTEIFINIPRKLFEAPPKNRTLKDQPDICSDCQPLDLQQNRFRA